jgi:hypothetical protein
MKDAEVIAKLKTICTEADPTLIYSNMRKIGQGYIVYIYIYDDIYCLIVLLVVFILVIQKEVNYLLLSNK